MTPICRCQHLVITHIDGRCIQRNCACVQFKFADRQFKDVTDREIDEGVAKMPRLVYVSEKDGPQCLA